MLLHMTRFHFFYDLSTILLYVCVHVCVHLLGFYLVSSFGRYSFVTLFCQICCFYFFVSYGLFMFPDLGEVAFCRRPAVCLNSTLPFGPQSYVCSRGDPDVGCMHPSVVVG